MSRIDRDMMLLVLAVSLSIMLSGLFLGSLLVYASNHPNPYEEHSIVGAPYDWYPQDQEDPQAFIRGFDGERYRLCHATKHRCIPFGPTRPWGHRY